MSIPTLAMVLHAAGAQAQLSSPLPGLIYEDPASHNVYFVQTLLPLISESGSL